MSTERFNLAVPALAGVLLILATFWVPVSWLDTSPYPAASLLQNWQPRALLGTIADLFNLDASGYTILKLGCLFIWLTIVIQQLDDSLGEQPHRTLLLAGCGALFAFSTVTVITLGPAGFIDIAPYALSAGVVALLVRCDWQPDNKAVAAITAALLLAVVGHEKALFEIAILIVWSLWRTGWRNTAKLFAPAVILSLLYLMSVASTSTSGLSAEGYAGILSSGLGYLLARSLNVWGILAGGGALWVLYGLFAAKFIAGATDSGRRAAVTATMLLLCLATLLIAGDTNRMVALIWLPTLLLITAVNPAAVFPSTGWRAGLVVLCLLQLANPPVLMYRSGIVPFNCYSLAIAKRLPQGENVAQGPFDIYAHNRPDLLRDLVERCNN